MGATTGFVCGLGVGGAHAGGYDALDTFARVLAQIDTSYVAPVSQQVLVHAALRGMTEVLDAHSRFLDPVTFQRMEAADAGRFVGIGAGLTPDTCGLVVQARREDGPAARAGLRAGDCIRRADTIDLAGMPYEEAVAWVSGTEGTAVTLEIARGDDMLTIPVLRAPVQDPLVDRARTPDGVSHLRLHAFRPGAAQALADALVEHPRAVVLDLRDNPGGRLEEAVAVADLFLRKGTIVTIRGREGAGQDAMYAAHDQSTDWDGPLVVLVNEGSASASEIVAGALRDHERAILVGASTWGKGTVQALYAWEDGSALKLTVARYVLPSGRTIADRVGLTPDITVPSAAVPHAPAPSGETPGLPDDDALDAALARLRNP